MKFTNESAADEPEINLISLIDVILVLLIFFMATATFEHQSRVKLNLPQASDEISERDSEESLVLQISADGRYFVGNSEVVNNTLEALKEALLASGTSDKSQRVIIRADASSEHQYVVRAMDAVSQLGFSNLSIATVRPKAAP